MKRYAKVVLYAYPLLATVGKDYEEHVKNKAVLSYDSKWTAEALAEYLAGEILQMRRLEWLKAKVEEVLDGLSAVERTLIAVRYFGKSKRIKALPKKGEQTGDRYGTWTERTYFRKQQRLGEKVTGALRLAGVTEEVYAQDFAEIDFFRKIEGCIAEGKEQKISANERRWLGII